MANVSSSNSHKGLAPQLRFQGFSNEWQQDLLCNVFNKINQRNANGKIKNVICNSAQKGLIPQREYFDKDIANSENTNGYYIIKQNDFVYNPRKSVSAPYGPISLYKYSNDGIVSPLYLCFRSNGAINVTFYEWYFKSPVWHRYVYLFGDSGVRHDRVSIKDAVFFEMPLRIPDIAEQEKIAGFLSLFEKKIQKQQQLVDNLKSYKRGAIARYFSEQIDNENWTNTTISNCLFYEQPQKYIVRSEHYSDEYKTPVLTANKAFILGHTNETDGIYDKGEVLIYDDFTMEVKYVNFPFKVKSSTIKMLTPKRNIDLYFMFNLLQYLELKPEGHQRSYISILEPMEIKIPCYEEQRQAAKLFRLLDNKIEKEQFILQKLLQLKSGLLQQLFI